MFILDLKKDSVLLVLLQNMLRTARKIKSHDDSLNNVMRYFESILANPAEVDYYDIHNKIAQFAEIIKSYQVKGSDDETLLSDLPNIIHSFVSGLDDLKTRTYLDKKYFSSTAELEGLAERFSKLAAK